MTEEAEIMNAYTVVFDGLDHLGPADPAITRKLVERLRPTLPPDARVADFGCGTGASTLVLAENLSKAHVLPLDGHAPFVERLETTDKTRGLGQRLHAVVGDLADPSPLDGITGEFDLLWAESAIYSIGRTNAFTRWRPLLKPGGWIVFNDVVWRSGPGKRSNEVAAFWRNEYPNITTAETVLEQLTAAGFDPLDPTLLDRKVWSNYYEPLRERLRPLSKQDDHPQALIDLIAEFEHEIRIYDCTEDEIALAFFCARSSST